MSFDKKILELSRTIYQTSIMAHGTKQDPENKSKKLKTQSESLSELRLFPMS